MDRRVRDALASVLVSLLLTGCASTGPVQTQEGQIALRAGAAGPGAAPAGVIAGPAILHPAVLEPASDAAWQVVWVETGGKGAGGGGQGTYAGLLTGLGFIRAVPMAVMTWPVAAGIIVGMAALGTVGELWDPGTFTEMDAGDRMALLEAAAVLQPERLLRESTAEALAARMGGSPFAIPWYAGWGPDTPGNDPLADARERGADGLLDVFVEAFGLAVGEEADTFGVFARVRARLLEPASARLRYERVLEYGPGRPLAGLPRPATHTLAFLTVDSARVFRYEMREAIVRMARILAEDPALPLGPR